LERFKITARTGKLELRSFLNARAKSTTLAIDDSECDLDLSGKPYDGTAEVFFEGVPKRLKLTVPRSAGLHVEGPSVLVARFDRDGMALAGTSLESSDWASRRCKLRLYFSRPIPKLDIQWTD